MFGYKKGSFTGAASDKPGLFQAADGGTLFLDEIADLPLAMQVKLLRAIQEKSVRPVGGQQEIPVDARIISASHQELNAEVERGTFRQDLFYRINVIELRIPTLRERPEDIPLLAEHIVARIAADSARAQAALDDAARHWTLSFPRQRARAGKHPGARHGPIRRRHHRLGRLHLPQAAAGTATGGVRAPMQHRPAASTVTTPTTTGRLSRRDRKASHPAGPRRDPLEPHCRRQEAWHDAALPALST